MNKNILSYSAKWFVLIIVAATLLWAVVFDAMTQPKDTETINVFVTANSCDTDKIKQKIATDGIATGVTFATETDSYYPIQFSTVALINSDIIIMSSDRIPQEDAQMQYAELSEELLQKHGLDEKTLSFVGCQGKNYAIVVFDKQNGINLLDGLAVFDEEKVYCVAVNVTRPNAYPYSDDKENTENAFVALAKLLAN